MQETFLEKMKRLKNQGHSTILDGGRNETIKNLKGKKDQRSRALRRMLIKSRLKKG